MSVSLQKDECNILFLILLIKDCLTGQDDRMIKEVLPLKTGFLVKKLSLCHKPEFEIPISLQPGGVSSCHSQLRLFDLT